MPYYMHAGENTVLCIGTIIIVFRLGSDAKY